LYAGEFVSLALPRVPRDSLDRREEDFLLLLEQWDGRMGRQGLEPALYAVFMWKTIEAVFKDEMGDSLFAHFVRLPNVPMRVLIRLLRKGQSKWFDDVRTPANEDVSTTLLRAYRAAFQFLQEKLGRNIGRWRWGNLHRLTFRHPLSSNWVAAQIFNSGGFPHPGGICTLNNAAFELKGDFSAIVGPSLRLVADLSSGKAGVFAIQVPGQSEVPRTRYFANLIDTWRRGELLPVGAVGLETEKEQVLILTP